MKVTVYGSHLCPDTLYAINQLMSKGVDMSFKNISAALSDLKEFLAIRENDAIFDNAKKNGGLGIPCFVLEDGTRTHGHHQGNRLIAAQHNKNRKELILPVFPVFYGNIRAPHLCKERFCPEVLHRSSASAAPGSDRLPHTPHSGCTPASWGPGWDRSPSGKS